MRDRMRRERGHAMQPQLNRRSAAWGGTCVPSMDEPMHTWLESAVPYSPTLLHTPCNDATNSGLHTAGQVPHRVASAESTERTYAKPSRANASAIGTSLACAAGWGDARASRRWVPPSVAKGSVVSRQPSGSVDIAGLPASSLEPWRTCARAWSWWLSWCSSFQACVVAAFGLRTKPDHSLSFAKHR